MEQDKDILELKQLLIKHNVKSKKIKDVYKFYIEAM